MWKNNKNSASEKRAFKRAQYECKINICYSDCTLEATVKNIGQGGVMVVFDKEMPRGLPVKVEVFLDQGKTVKCEGNIVWSFIKTDIFGDSKTIYETGIQFIDLSKEDKELIGGIVGSMDKEQEKIIMAEQEFKERILNKHIEEEVKESYLSYAMSVIVGRALPDIRDGLKPVHRRILYAMHDLHIRHNGPHKKCARIVGECLGKYHPHGDIAVYDSLVRMAQDFSLRYPLIDGQGNFGSIDGDPPAAMRYSEARLSKIADYVLQDLDKDTVKFFPNFDNSLIEPEVLPSVLPNLLINGSSGIAVGMATNIPPHNLGEVCDAIDFLLDNPKASIKELHKYIKGPDFPTGGIICGKGDILKMYEDGKGKLTLRAKATIEHEKNRAQVVVRDVPYQLNKSNLLEAMAALISDKKIEGVSDLRDESDKEGVRIVLEVKRDAQPEIILNQLYKHTNLETTFGANFLALVNRRPQILNLKDFLVSHIAFRKEVIVRRTKFELDKASKRAHILEGLKIALKFLDQVVELIRKSKSPQEAKEGLMSKFKLTEVQAQAILEMQLQRLCALEREKIEQEYLELIKRIEYYNSILASEKKQEALIKGELAEIKEKFADERRTEIVAQKEEIEIEDLIVEEDMVVTITGTGYIKRIPLTAYRQQKRGGRGVAAMGTSEEDFVEHLFVASSKDTMLIFTNEGKVYPMKTYEIPVGTRTSKGRAIVNLLNLTGKEKAAAALSITEFDPKKYIFLATESGVIKRSSLELFANMRKNGICAITLDKDDALIGVGICEDSDEAVLATQDGLSIRFPMEDVRPTGRQSQGVRGINLSKGDKALGMVLIKKALKKEEFCLLTATANGYAKRTDIDEYRVQSRGGKGIINIKLSDKIGEVKSLILVRGDDEVMCITNKGILIRTKVADIRSSGRSTQGVKIINLEDGDKLSTVARIIPEE